MSMQAEELVRPAATRIKPVSYREMHGLAIELARKLEPMGPFDTLVGVAKGGLFPLTPIANLLGVKPVGTIQCSQYAIDGERLGEPRIIASLAPEIEEILREGGRAAFIDDLVDTGATARKLKKLYPHAVFAVLYAKPQGEPFADVFVEHWPDQDLWIGFPWDGEEEVSYRLLTPLKSSGLK